MSTYSPLRPVMLVGGAGVVGTQIASLLRQRYPDLPLLIAGRRQEPAHMLASKLGNASSIIFDITSPSLPKEIEPCVIVALANDPANSLLKFALSASVPYIDITRWTSRLHSTLLYTATLGVLKTPVIFSSSWMAGIPAAMILQMTRELTEIERIDIDILYAVEDRAGPNSVDYMDRLDQSFYVIENGHRVKKEPLSDGKRVTFDTNKEFTVYRFDTPDQSILPLVTGAKTVSSRIGFDNVISNSILHILVRSGLWKLITGDKFINFRRSLLYKPGQGGAHKVKICVEGRMADGSMQRQTKIIIDPAGQTHLTAIGATTLIERVIEPSTITSGISFGELLMSDGRLEQSLKNEGVIVLDDFVK